MKNIELAIMHRAIIRGQTRLYRFNDALFLVDMCEKNGVPILGVDSFFVTDSITLPQLEHSADFSLEPSNVSSYELARAFLDSKKNLDFVYEIVY